MKKTLSVLCILNAGCLSGSVDPQQVAQGIASSDASSDVGDAADVAVTSQGESSEAVMRRRTFEPAPERAAWLSFQRSTATSGGARALASSSVTMLSGGSSLVPRTPHPKPTTALTCANIPEFNVIRVKFVEGTAIRLDANGLFYSANGPAFTPAMAAELAQINAYANLQRSASFDNPVSELLQMKTTAEKNTGEEHPELSLWFDIVNGTSLVAVAGNPSVCNATANLLNWLNAFQVVEVASPVPANVSPPTIPVMNPGYDLTTPSGAWDPPHMLPFNPSGMTFGLNSPETSASLAEEFRAAWQGSGATLVDIERNWYWHEKIGDVYRIPGGVIGNALPGDDIHGTAAMSVAMGTHRSWLLDSMPRYGTRGFAPRVLRAFSAADKGVGTGWVAWAAGVGRANLQIEQEDVILIEQQNQVTGATGPYLTAVESEGTTYDAIRTTTSWGRIVVEPTGNGGASPNNIDTVTAGNPNSGAIIVSWNQGGSSAQVPAFGAGFGSRVDVNAWGGGVLAAATAGYAGSGNQGPFMPQNENYINGFGGSSGASAIIAGAVAQMSAMYRTTYGHAIAPPAQVAPTMRSVIQVAAPFQLIAGGANYGWQPDVERSVTEYLLATRISASGSTIATPHNNWATATLGSGVWAYANYNYYDYSAWLTMTSGAAGVTMNEAFFSAPTGPLDLGWNPDRSFVIEARVQIPNATSDWQVIVAKENPRNYGMWVSPSWWPSPGRLHFSYQLDGTTTLCPLFSTRRIDDNVVHHVAVRFDRRASVYQTIPKVEFFIDGTADPFVSGCGAVGPAASGGAGQDTLTIAARMALYSWVGDVRLYHRYVTDAEIVAHRDRLR